MNQVNPRYRWLSLMAALVAGLWLAAPALGHCDTVDGPVAIDVNEAIASQNLKGVLKWVNAEDEAEVRPVFEQALRVRASGGEAAAMADRYFMETVVRLHRLSEGEPYTGLKPAGLPLSPTIGAVDAALAEGSVDTLIEKLQEEVAHAVRRRYERAQAAAAQASQSVEAGREAVHAYVELVHFVKPLHEMLAGVAHGHEIHAGVRH